MNRFIKTNIALFSLVGMTLLPSCGQTVHAFEGRTLTAGQVGNDYLEDISNGDEDMYYDLDYDSSLPSGLILYDDGRIKGVPKEKGTFNFKAVMIDLNDVEYYADFSLTIEGGHISYTGSALPSGKQNEPYEQSVATATGMNDVTYALKDGAVLPNGLTVSEEGVLSGIPSEYGEYNFAVVASALGCDDVEATFTLSIAQGEQVKEDEGKIIFEDFTLEDGEVGTAYSASVRKAYGVPNITYKFRFSSGAGLPSGLSANKDLGTISGTPTDSTEGSITFRVIASAEGYEDATAYVTLTVKDPYVETDTFEAEYVNGVPHLSGAGYSSAPSGKGMIQSCPKCSNGHVLGYLNKAEEITYTISADDDTTGTLSVGLGSDNGDVTYDPDMFGVKVNGTEVSYTSISFEQIGTTESDYESTECTISTSISLSKGENTIVFNIYESDKATGTYSAVGCLFDYMKISNTTQTIGWRPRTGNVSA